MRIYPFAIVYWGRNSSEEKHIEYAFSAADALTQFHSQYQFTNQSIIRVLPFAVYKKELELKKELEGTDEWFDNQRHIPDFIEV